MSRSYSKGSKRKHKLGRNKRFDDYGYATDSFNLKDNYDSSPDEGILEIFELIDRISKQTDKIMANTNGIGFDSDSIDDDDYSDDYSNGLNLDLPKNSRITHSIIKYQEHITKLSSENRGLKRQLAELKYHLNKDLNAISEKLQNVQNRHRRYADLEAKYESLKSTSKSQENKFEDIVKRILKDVDRKMIELENEYKKRLNYYKGFKENRKFVDTKYDRVFGSLDEEPRIDSVYEGIYSGTDTEESHIPRELNSTPYNLKRESECKSTISPLRRKYTGIDSGRL